MNDQKPAPTPNRTDSGGVQFVAGMGISLVVCAIGLSVPDRPEYGIFRLILLLGLLAQPILGLIFLVMPRTRMLGLGIFVALVLNWMLLLATCKSQFMK